MSISSSDLPGPKNADGYLPEEGGGEGLHVIGLMASSMAHDVNNILQMIAGNLEMLASELPLHNAAERRIRNAQSGVEIGAALTASVLDYCRHRTWSSLHQEPVDASRFCGLQSLLCDAVGPGVIVELVVPTDLWPIRLNFVRFQNALINLAINARDAVQGSGKLTVVARNAPAESPDLGDRVIVSVEDDGGGIPDYLIERIFSPFFTTKPDGTGLGLAIVVEFARRSGAEISVTSAPGQGTTFFLDFPRAR